MKKRLAQSVYEHFAMILKNFSLAMILRALPSTLSSRSNSRVSPSTKEDTLGGSDNHWNVEGIANAAHHLDETNPCER